MASMSRVLILSDGRMGHVNQSLAFAKYLNLSYDVIEVQFKNKFYKALSYVFDNLGLSFKALFKANVTKNYEMVIGAGSRTYYATKVLARQMNAKSVAMMLPKGYRLDFDIIFAQSHDNPLKKDNIIEVPANFAYVQPAGIYRAEGKAIGVVIGGDNKVFQTSVENLKKQLDFIQKHYSGYEIAITTSPRTSKEVEKLVESFHFDYEVVFSKKPINPIPDFLEQCETVFVTADSTSMISEAVSYGQCNVVVLPLEHKKESKFSKFIRSLAQKGYVHIFDGTIEKKNKKIDFMQYIPKATL